MQGLDSAHLNYGGNASVAESGNHPTGKPHVRRTDDGLEAEFPARADYDLGILTVREAANETVLADGGTETTVYDVYRCGGCARVYGEEDAITTKVVEGKLSEYDTPRCPHCGTKIDNERTAKSTAEFELPTDNVEGDR